MRPSTRASRLLAAVSSAALMLAGLVLVPAAARANETTVSTDTLRTGWDQNEPNLSPAAVSASDFGQLFSTAVNGQVYAQPIVVNGTIIAATENDWIYGISEATGAITWSRSVGAPWPASAIGCGDLTPNVGITGTPVYDPTSNAVYFLAKVNDGTDVNNPHWYLHSIDPATGNERSGWPVTVQGSPTNNPGDSFDAKTAMQRPGLLLLGGVVYAGFGSHCDYGPYVGYVAGFSTTSPTMTTLWSTESTSSSGMAGIWQSGGGLVSDGPGRIILATGNGISPPPGPGTSPPGNLAESVIRLQVNSNGSLSAQDFFSPTNNGTLDQNDTDFGSGGPMALPAGFGTTAHPNLLVQTGKDGRVYLLDRNNLGGMGQGPGGGDNSIGPPVGPYNGVWGHPAFWGGNGGYVYQVENQGYLRAYQYGVNGSGLPALSSAGTSASTFGYTSGSPVVTSNGTTSGSALVWVVYTDGSTGVNGQLRAYDAVPVNGQLNLRFSAPIGNAVKFAVPATDGGRVFVGTRDGYIYGFGAPTTAPLTGSTTAFGNVAVGSTANATMTVTATRTVTISAITTSAPFGATPPALPVTLNSGATLSVPVQFAPTVPGGATGSLQFTTDSGTVPLTLTGTGTQPGLGATPSALSFGTVPTGSSVTLSVGIANTGTSPETITGSTVPSAPFTATGLPANGSTLAAGASVTVSVAYAPTAVGNQSGSLVVNGSAGSVTVPLTGTAVTGTPHLTITPNPVAFGSVPVGQSATQSFNISNTGNTTLTITKAAPPVGTFSTATPISEGQQLPPGAIIQQSVTFNPTTSGAQSAVYSITGDDGQGAIAVQLTGTGSTTVGTTNIAAGMPTSASGSQSGYPPSNATDSDVNSYWESTNNAFPQWLQVDLGAPNTVGMLTLRLPPQTTWPDRTQTLSVLGSLDGNTFTTLVQSAGYLFSDSTGNYVDINVPPTSARYLRLNFTANTGWPAGQLSSFEVYPVVSGNGPATLSASPTSLSFAATPINNNSDWQMVTVTNTGTGPAAVSSISASGDFTETSTCGSTLAPGANCVATVTFHPTAAGTRTGTLTVTSNASDNPVTVALSGSGTATGSATLSASPASVAFGATNVGTVSGAVPVTVTNTGTAAASVSAVSVTTQFAQTNNCGTLAAGATCTVNVTFNPTAAGNVSGSLTVTSNAANSPLTVALSGTATASSTTNLALNMPTSESSNTQNYVSANAVDGNQSTYWESANNAFPQWLQVDLGSTQTVGRIVLELPNSTAWNTRTQTVTITGSTDGNTFTTLVASANYTFNPATANTATITFTTANVRYVRLTFTANTGWPAGQCSEFEVFSS